MMTTGMANLRRAGGSRYAVERSMCYVAEVTSGKVAAYAIPWSPTMYAAGQPQSAVDCAGRPSIASAQASGRAASRAPGGPQARD